jgi:predicted SprT family Zn-dependent metalloprotease
MYVILHELAHLCNYDRNGYPIMGHGEEFRQIFKLLVAESMDIGVYKYENYTQKPEEYCGIMITTNIAN